MKKVNCYLSDNGALETDPVRAAAHNIVRRIEKLRNQSAFPQDAEISFLVALTLINNRDIISTVFEEFEEALTTYSPDKEIDLD